MAYSPDAVAMWLLGRLSAIDDGNRGRNLIGILLDQLFPGTGGIGNMTQVDHTGIPSGSGAQKDPHEEPA